MSTLNTIVVLMSVYKNDKLEYVKSTMNSLYNQTFKEFDIFIQCDGVLSKDLEQFLDEAYTSEKITLLNKRAINKGLAYSLNELIKIALDSYYEYFIRMDADDISVFDRIDKQYQFMQKNKDVDICGGFIEEFNMDTNEKQVIKYSELHNDILIEMKKRNPIAHVTAFIRKDFFEKVGLYDENKLNEDFDLWIRGFINKCKFYNIQDVLVEVRTNSGFFGRRKNIKRAIEIMQLKFKATKIFKFGITGYIYAILHFMLFMSPSRLKQFMYKYLR